MSDDKNVVPSDRHWEHNSLYSTIENKCFSSITFFFLIHTLTLQLKNIAFVKLYKQILNLHCFETESDYVAFQICLKIT